MTARKMPGYSHPDVSDRTTRNDRFYPVVETYQDSIHGQTVTVTRYAPKQAPKQQTVYVKRGFGRSDIVNQEHGRREI